MIQDEMDVIFKLTTSPSLISLLFPSNVRLKDISEPYSRDGMGKVIFKLATLDELNDVSNLN